MFLVFKGGIENRQQQNECTGGGEFLQVNLALGEQKTVARSGDKYNQQL